MREKEMPIVPQRFAHLREELAVSLTTKEITGTECNQYTAPRNPVIFRLDLRYPDGTVRTLREDPSLYESRRCPLDYGIGEIYY